MKNIILPILVASCVSAHAASIIPITGTSATRALGGSIAATLNDPGAYNPDTGASGFDLSYDGSRAFHGDLTTGEHRLVYGLQATHVTSAASPTVALDFYGRNSSTERDNNYTVTLYNTSGQVAQQTAQTADDSTFYNRTTFNLGAGRAITRVEITSPAGSGNPNQYFTVAEVRLVSVESSAVPEPSSTALIGFGGLALILRRRK